MSLDDRELREHLDRRAHSELTDPDDLAEAVIGRLPGVAPARWWQTVGSRTRTLGVAVAALAATVVVAVAILPPRAEPGSQGPPSAGTSVPTVAPTPAGTPLIDTGAISVLDLSLSTDTVVLEALETADVTLSVTFGAEVVVMGQMDLTTTPLACMRREQPVEFGSEVLELANDFTRVGGTNTWQTTFRFTASQAGTWHVTCLQAHDADGNALSDKLIGIHPYALGWSPELTIEGSHRPTLTIGFNPDPGVIGRPLEVFGRVADENGAPFGDVEVTIGRDNACAEGGAGETVKTDKNGNYSYTMATADQYAVCAWLLEKPGAYPNPFQSTELNAVYANVFAHPDVR